MELIWKLDQDESAFVSDGILAMFRQSDILPCVFDAAAFSSFDGDRWTEDNLVW